jgi:hypothetical protein
MNKRLERGQPRKFIADSSPRSMIRLDKGTYCLRRQEQRRGLRLKKSAREEWSLPESMRCANAPVTNGQRGD